MSTPVIGLGDLDSTWLNVYIANRPPLDEYLYLDELMPLKQGTVAYIAQQTGNHWRKIFNVFSKLLFSYREANVITSECETWQDLRDKELLQPGSQIRLLFSAPCIKSESIQSEGIHLIMGKQYSIDLGYNSDHHEGMIRIDNDFSIWPDKKLIVCPYFDYRQLSNIKIEKLVGLINSIG